MGGVSLSHSSSLRTRAPISEFGDTHCVRNLVTEITMGVPRRPDAELKMAAVRTGIGATLRADYSDALREPLTEEMAELLKRLDQPPESR